MSEILATNCGSRAYRETTIVQSGEVIGVTSRGFFIKLTSKRIIFLSSESFLNPLNINLEPFPSELREVALSEKVDIGGGCVLIPKLDSTVRVLKDRVHQIRAASQEFLPQEEQIQILRKVSQEILKLSNSEKFAAVLPTFLADKKLFGQNERILARFRSLNNSTQDNDLDQIKQILKGFIGEGSGLTPSGDDLVCGYLLAINRWNPRHWQKVFLENLNNEIISVAFQRTTTLSANLIEIAAAGEADERLILALDFIFTGNPTLHETVELLSSYGSSSGMDAFCGMAIAVK